MIQVNKKIFVYRSSWVQLIRPMTLTGTVSPILASTALAATDGVIHWDRFIVMLIAALLVQATANMLNDYYDFKDGQDQEKWIRFDSTKYLSGPGHHKIPIIVGVMVSISVLLGIWLSLHSTVWVGIVGAISMIAGYKYSAGPRSFSAIGLGELIAAIFLGMVVTTLAYVVQGHTIGLPIICVSLPYAFLIASMILTNNIRDIEKDRPFRTTLALLLGRNKAVGFLYVVLILAYLSVIFLVMMHLVSWPAILIVIAVPFAIRLLWCFRPDARRTDELKGMKWSAWHHWAFGLLLACSIWLST